MRYYDLGVHLRELSNTLDIARTIDSGCDAEHVASAFVGRVAKILITIGEDLLKAVEADGEDH